MSRCTNLNAFHHRQIAYASLLDVPMTQVILDTFI